MKKKSLVGWTSKNWEENLHIYRGAVMYPMIYPKKKDTFIEVRITIEELK